MRQRLQDYLPLGLILLLAMVLRVWGLDWGLPSATHYFSYHPDESIILGAAMRMNLLQGHLLPHFYNYGSLQLYLILFANTFAYLFGHGGLIIKNLAAQHAQWAGIYLVGRWITVFMGAGTVWTVAALGTRLWGRLAGLIGAFVLAIMPLHVQESHWMTVDVPAAFWATLSLYWSARLITDDPKPLRAAILAGVFSGLAAATKYNLALMLLPLLLAWLWMRDGKKIAVADSAKPFLSGLVASGVAFLIACPGFLFDRVIFWKNFDYEAYHVRHLPGLTFQDTGNGFIYQIVHNLDPGLGITLLLLSIAGFVYALWRHKREDWLLLVFFVPFYVLISVVIVRYTRYIIPLLPIIALWIGRLAADISRIPSPAPRRIALFVVAVIAALTFWNTITLIRPMAQTDDRDVAEAELLQMNPTQIGFAVDPWFGTPPVSPWFCAPIPNTWKTQTSEALMKVISYAHDWNLQQLQADPPPVIALSEYDYDDALRLKLPQTLAYLQLLRSEYTLKTVIAGPDGVPARVDGLPTRGLPTDMLYTDPIISIYVRK